MHPHHEQQDNPRRPERLDVGLQEMAVAIDGLRPQENLQVARQMPRTNRNRMNPVAAIRYFLPSDDVKSFVNILIGKTPRAAPVFCPRRRNPKNLMAFRPGSSKLNSFLAEEATINYFSLSSPSALGALSRPRLPPAPARGGPAGQRSPCFPAGHRPGSHAPRAQTWRCPCYGPRRRMEQWCERMQ